METNPNELNSEIRKSRPFLFLIGWCVSLLCLFFVFHKVAWNELSVYLTRLRFDALLLAVVLVNAHNFILAKRWHILLNHIGDVNYWTAFWSLRISFFFNASLPARLGEPFRVYYIKQTSNISVARVLGAMGADRFLDFVSLAAILYLSAVVLGLRGTLPPASTILTATIIISLIVIALAKLPHHSRHKWLSSVLQFRVRIFEGIASLKDWRILLPTVPISLLGWVIEALLIVIFANDIGSPISLFKAFMVVAAVNVAISIPSTPAHLGTFELGAVTMLNFFGVSTPRAAMIAILYHMVQLIPTIVIGAYGYQTYIMKSAKAKPVASLAAYAKMTARRKSPDDSDAENIKTTSTK